ncbi:MAG: zinc metallopeptidase [Ruminococcaceae bacterium]|nr:zinc metallopeptidase [Oscillospiraceae bacterium]
MFDFSYVILVLPMLLLSMIAQANVSSTFQKYSRILAANRMTAAEAARRILDSRGLHHIQIIRVAGNLTDHFDPKNNVLALSETVHDSPSVAAIGVAAHEAGHAIQHAEGYVPVRIRSAIVPITQFGSKLSMPIVILGLILGVYPLAYAGILLFGTVAVFQLVTLPTEFDASRRAMAVLSEGYLTDEERVGTKKVLTAAAMTYVAALFVSLASLLRLLLIVNRRR